MKYLTFKIPLFLAMFILLLISKIAIADIQGVAINFPDAPTSHPPYYPVYIFQNGVQIDYVTSVPTANGFGFVNPISFLPFTAGQNNTYNLYYKESGTWYTCAMTITPAGTLATNSCTGAVVANTSDTAATINMSAANFASVGSAPANYQASKPVPTRTVTFINSTQFSSICINTQNEQFNNANCKGPNDVVVNQGTPVTINVPSSGLSSGAYAVTGYLNNNKWQYSGRDSSGNVYATKFEPTMYPQTPVTSGTTNHTVGVTYIDASLVDGFNFGVTVYPNSSAMCGHADTSGNNETNVYSQSNPMSLVPANGASIISLCPASQTVSSSNQTIGCYSDCTYAHVTNQPASITNAYCCAGSDSTSSACNAAVDHSTLPYNSLVDQFAQNVYAWAYDDNSGTFTCDPNASFTFEITASPASS